MGERKRQNALPVDGVLLLNKPAGVTSNGALQQVKRMFRARKAGHTGSLDPAATGMLPICFGEATKVSAFLLEADKQYRVVAKLGEARDTGDGDGDTVDSAAVPELSRAQWLETLSAFLGESEQVPPMYSALKKDGKRLYELARKGEVVEREPRKVRIDALALLEAHGSRLVFRVRCSKGTYVRTLVEDIARRVGTLAYTASLHRETVGDFDADGMIGLSRLKALAAEGREALQSILLPVDAALRSWPQVVVSGPGEERFGHGQAVQVDPAEAGLVRVYGAGGRFLGVGARAADGALCPRRVFHLGG